MKPEIKNLQPDWKNSPSVNDLSSDLVSASSYQERVRDKLRRYANIRSGGKKITAEVGKSTSRPKVVRKFNEWKYASMEEPFLSTSDMFDVLPRTAEDMEAAKQNAILLNYQWGTKIDKVKLVGDIVRSFVDEGTIIVKVGWSSREELAVVEEDEPVYATAEESLKLLQEAVQQGRMSPEQAQAMVELGEPVQTGTKKVYVERVSLRENRPSYEVCIPSNVTIDPTCDGILEEANFVIHEFDTSYSELKVQEQIVDTETKEVSGIYSNLESIAFESIDKSYDDFLSVGSNEFTYSDKARKKVRAYEYWGFWDIDGTGELTSIVATWVGNTMIRLEKNPFAHNELPFSIAQYMPVKREVHGEPDAELLEENQTSIGRMVRAAEDITDSRAEGQTFIDEGFFPNPTQKNNYENKKTTYYRSGFNPATAIYKTKVEDIPRAVFDMINLQQTDAESLTGTKAFGGGNGLSGSALGSSATGIRSALDATAKRELSILRRLSALFKSMARLTISNNQEFLSEEEVVRITGKEFVTIRRDDLAGEFDLKVTISTPEKDQQQASDLAMVLQTGQGNLPFEITQFIWTQLAELKNLPTLAEKLRTYRPEPDEKAIALQELELENARLANIKLKKDIEEGDSRISERLSRSIENEIDRQLKEAKKATELAKANLYDAQAEKALSETDGLDQEFIRKQDGVDRREQFEDTQLRVDAKNAEEENKHILDMQKQAAIKKANEAIRNNVGENDAEPTTTN